MKTWGSGGIVPPFLTAALDESEWSASHPGCFTTHGKGPPVPNGKGNWVGLRASLDAVEKGKILSMLEIKPWTASTQPIVMPSYGLGILTVGNEYIK
jgi:hypothetical protein